MYNNFTVRAKKVLQFADEAAKRLNCDCIGTEHLLLGLTKVRDGVAVKVLKNLDIDLGRIHNEVEKKFKSGSGSTNTKQRELTPAAKKAIKHAEDEAKELNHELIDTEHLLLGLLHEPADVAAEILIILGLKLEEVREEILYVLDRVDL